jgi:hypothetical protein
MDDRVPFNRRHLQLGLNLARQAAVTRSGEPEAEKDSRHTPSLNGLPSTVSHRVEASLPQLLTLKQTGSKLAPGRVRPPSGMDQQLGPFSSDSLRACRYPPLDPQTRLLVRRPDGTEEVLGLEEAHNLGLAQTLN